MYICIDRCSQDSPLSNSNNNININIYLFAIEIAGTWGMHVVNLKTKETEGNGSSGSYHVGTELEAPMVGDVVIESSFWLFQT